PVPDAVLDRAVLDSADRASATGAVFRLDYLAFGISDMVVVRAESDVRLSEPWIGSLDDAYDIPRVLRPDDAIVCVQIDRALYVLKGEMRQRLLLLGFILQIGVLRVLPAEKKLEKLVASGYGRSYGTVQPLRGRKISRLDRDGSRSKWIAGALVA